MESLNALYEKYRSALVSFRETFKEENLSGPLLMKLDAYYKQSVKLLIVGQQTYGWSDEYDDFNASFETYENFNLGERYRSTPFWSIIRKVEDIIGISNYSCAWTNLNRYDQDGDEPKGLVLENIQVLDHLVKDEISILNPDICIFFTNRKYDYRLKNIFPNININSIDGLKFDHFVKIEHNTLPTHSYRFPHPKTIRMQKWENNFLHVMEKILPKATDF